MLMLTGLALIHWTSVIVSTLLYKTRKSEQERIEQLEEEQATVRGSRSGSPESKRHSEPPQPRRLRLARQHRRDRLRNVVVMGAIAAGSTTDPRPGKLAAAVAATVVVLWIAHVYSHALAETVRIGRRLDWAELASVAHRELAIVLARWRR